MEMIDDVELLHTRFSEKDKLALWKVSPEYHLTRRDVKLKILDFINTHDGTIYKQFACFDLKSLAFHMNPTHCIVVFKPDQVKIIHNPSIKKENPSLRQKQEIQVRSMRCLVDFMYGSKPENYELQNSDDIGSMKRFVIHNHSRAFGSLSGLVCDILDANRLYVDMLQVLQLIDELGITQPVYRDDVHSRWDNVSNAYVMRHTGSRGVHTLRIHPSILLIVKNPNLLCHQRYHTNYSVFVTKYYQDCFDLSQNPQAGIKRKLFDTESSELDNTLHMRHLVQLQNPDKYGISTDQLVKFVEARRQRTNDSKPILHDDWRILADNSEIILRTKINEFLFLNVDPQILVKHIMACL